MEDKYRKNLLTRSKLMTSSLGKLPTPNQLVKSFKEKKTNISMTLARSLLDEIKPYWESKKDKKCKHKGATAIATKSETKVEPMIVEKLPQKVTRSFGR